MFYINITFVIMISAIIDEYIDFNKFLNNTKSNIISYLLKLHDN